MITNSNFGITVHYLSALLLTNFQNRIPISPQSDTCSCLFSWRLYRFVGSGVMKIVNSCKAAGLPIPTLEEDVGGFMVKLFKDRFSKEQLEKFGLNDRQMKAVKYVKTKGKITNAEYQEINGIGKSVTIDELRDLVERQIFIRIGETGRGTYYELSNKNDRAM
ncbi:MAG: hypothetical protein LBS69_09005 [Prevotellaceae bacterium]|nr:hypothetical protein [Prevotellaceae bacterium]